MGHVVDSVDESAFWKQADASLIRYRGPFQPTIITRAKGSYIYDASGRAILDFTSGQMSSLVGHGHPEIARTLAQGFDTNDHLFSNFISPPVLNLSKALSTKLPAGLDCCMFLSTGGESNEAAIKMAKLYTGKFETVGLLASWHGQTAGANAATYQPERRGYGPVVGQHALPAPNAYRSKFFRHEDGSYDWKSEMLYGWDMIDKTSVGSLACCIVEPILSSGGVLPLPIGYLKVLQEECHKRGMLLIVDEAQTGVYRTGPFCAFEKHGMVPDILTLSKTLGAGVPLSAVVCSKEVEQVCFERDYSFYTTHVSDPLVAAVGLKLLEIVERDQLGHRAVKLGEQLRNALRSMQDRYGCIGDVRGDGLMIGLEIVKDQQTKEPDDELGSTLAKKLFELGLSANVTAKKGANSIFRIAPPLNVSDEDMEKAINMFEEAFKTVEGTKPL